MKPIWYVLLIFMLLLSVDYLIYPKPMKCLEREPVIPTTSRGIFLELSPCIKWENTK